MKFIKIFILSSFVLFLTFFLSISSTFAANYSITASAGTGGSISPTGTKSFTAGQSYIAPSGWVAGTPATSGYYSNPGQPYIAPSGYHPAQSYIPPTDADPGQEAIPNYYAYGQVTYSNYHFGSCYATSPGYPGFLSGTVNWNSDPGQPGPGSSAGGTLIYGTSPPLALSWTATEQLYSSGRYCLVYTDYYLFVYGYGGGQPYIPATYANPGQPAQDAYYDNPGQSYIAPSGWVAGTAATSGYYSNPGQAYIAPANQTYTITPNSGYNVSSVLVDGVNKGAIITYTFSNIQANHSISASFLIISGSLTATNCSIALNASSCPSNLAWNTTNPSEVSKVTTPSFITVATANTSTATYTVDYGSRNFFLYNNGIQLGTTATANATCVAGTHWGGSSCVSDNNAPNAPTITGPTTFYKNVNQTFNIKGTDPDSGDTIRYIIDWNMDGLGDYWEPLSSPYYASGYTMVSPNHSWPSSGSFQVLTQDINGVISGWTVFNFTANDQPVPGSIVSFTTDKMNVEFGQSANLTWASTDATSCRITSVPTPSVNLNGLPASGTKKLSPLKTTIYSLTCIGSGGDSPTSQVTVTVGKIKPTVKDI